MLNIMIGTKMVEPSLYKWSFSKIQIVFAITHKTQQARSSISYKIHDCIMNSNNACTIVKVVSLSLCVVFTYLRVYLHIALYLFRLPS